MKLARLLSLAAAAAAIAVQSYAAPTAQPGAESPSYVLMINDGGSSNGIPELEAMYGELAKTLGAAASRRVQLIGYTRTAAFEADYKRMQPQLLFVKTIDIASKAIRDDGYTVVAKRADPYIAGIVANPRLVRELEASRKATYLPVKATTAAARYRLDDLRCRELTLPKDTFTATLALATLRQKGIPYYMATDDLVDRASGCDSVAIRYVRYQDAVLEMMAGQRMVKSATGKAADDTVKDPGEWYHAAAGAINPTMLNEWRKDDRRAVISELPPMPNWAILVRRDVPEPTRQAMRQALLGLEGKAADKVLQPLKVKKLAPATDEEYLEVLRFIGN